MPLSLRSKSMVLLVRAAPSGSRDEIVGIRVDAAGLRQLVVKVTAAPEKGKANSAIIALLAKVFHVPKSAFALNSGETQRNKVFVINSHATEIAAAIVALEAETT